VTRIIRLTLWAALGLLLGAGCTINPTSSGGAASSGRIVVTEVPKSGVSNNAVWVVSPVGLNIHSSADVNAARVTTVAQGVRLDITEKSTVGPDTWLHVKSEGGNAEGWVVDRPDLVIHRQVSQHVEPSGWSILFPSEWSPVSGNPATFTGSSGPTGGSMLVQTADDPAKLMATPVSPGHELRQESPIEVYGRTTYLTVFKLDAGGFEFDARVQFPKTKVAYLFNFKQPTGTDADTSLFKQLLASAIVPGEG
jgi:Bacterial SH3 domain